MRQKEKEQKFEEQQEMQLRMFDLQQQALKAQREGEMAPARGITLVMEKEESKPRKRPLMKITIRKKGESKEEGEGSRKMRVLDPSQ